MANNIIKKNLYVFIILISLCLFVPALGNYFSGDDWFHLRIAQVQSLTEFLHFFSFNETAQSASFYRPLPTQVFFFLFQKVFGLQPLPYYVFVFTIFGASLYLIYLVAYKMFIHQKYAVLVLLFYAFSATHFTRLYFLSAFQEVLMMFFILLCVWFYLLNTKKIYMILSLGFFVAALLSKETAIVVPFLLIIIDWMNRTISLKRIVPFIALAVPYLLLRLIIFKGIEGESYIWSFSPVKVINTLMWYIFWSFGTPELLVDYIGSGFKILPKFFSDLHQWAYQILMSLALSLGVFGLIFITKLKQINKQIVGAAAIFILGLGPVLFLPWHKFTLELTLPLLGFSMVLAILLGSKKINFLGYLFIAIFVITNILTIVVTKPRHYSVTRSVISKKIVTYFQAQYPQLSADTYFYFINDFAYEAASFGASKQISYAASNSDLFRVLYQDKSIEVYYEDFPRLMPADKQAIHVSSKQFLE